MLLRALLKVNRAPTYAQHSLLPTPGHQAAAGSGRAMRAATSSPTNIAGHTRNTSTAACGLSPSCHGAPPVQELLQLLALCLRSVHLNGLRQAASAQRVLQQRCICALVCNSLHAQAAAGTLAHAARCRQALMGAAAHGRRGAGQPRREPAAWQPGSSRTAVHTPAVR